MKTVDGRELLETMISHIASELAFISLVLMLMTMFLNYVLMVIKVQRLISLGTTYSALNP